MKIKKVYILVFILLLTVIASDAISQPNGKNKSKRDDLVKVRWDTDMQWDWDDAGALAILNAMADAGEVKILGIGSSTRGNAGKWNPHTIDAICTYYRRPDIPIGKSLSGPSLNDMYGQWVSEQGYYYSISPEQIWDNTIKLYRKLLSEQADTSVVIVTVGYTTNINDLLLSEPDEYSNLNGKDLIAQKVKLWSCMGGRYPSSGGEANFQDWHGDTKYSIDNFPRPILGTSSETGNVSGAGSSLEFTPDENPVKGIYRKRLDEQGYPHTYSHSTWDLIATLVAVRDPNLYFDLTTSGTNVITIESNGEQTNEWQSSPDNGYRYLIQTNPSAVSSLLDELIGREPQLPEITATLTLFVSGEGSITPESGVFDLNESVTITATPASGYEFSTWTGDITGTPNPITITMDKDRELTAVFVEASAIDEEETNRKNALQIFPNPFVNSTTINFKINENANVKLFVFDMRGNKISLLLNQDEKPGLKTIMWNGTNNLGNRLKDGVYYLQLVVDQKKVISKKIIITH